MEFEIIALCVATALQEVISALQRHGNQRDRKGEEVRFYTSQHDCMGRGLPGTIYYHNEILFANEKQVDIFSEGII